MDFRQWLEVVENFPAILYQADSEQDFINKLQTLPKTTIQTIQDKVDRINLENIAQRLGTKNPILLYHGTPHFDKIDKSGFQLTKGQRTMAFLHAPYEVQNQGYFFTDSKETAHYFGQNRAASPNNYKLYHVYANVDHVLDMTNPDNINKELKSLGLRLIYEWSGKKQKRFYKDDIFWLLDKEPFINFIKNEGYSGVKFRENIKNLDKNSNTYLIFSKRNFIIYNKNNLILSDVESIWQQLFRK